VALVSRDRWEKFVFHLRLHAKVIPSAGTDAKTGQSITTSVPGRVSWPTISLISVAVALFLNFVYICALSRPPGIFAR